MVFENNRDFPGSPVAEASPSNEGVWVQSLVAKISHATWSINQTVKQKQYCNKFNSDFKNGVHPKNLKNNKNI